MIKGPRRYTGVAGHHFSFFPNHVASNSLYSKCAILKSVSKELTLQGISNAKNRAETRQVYLVVEDNVLISTRRGD